MDAKWRGTAAVRTRASAGESETEGLRVLMVAPRSFPFMGGVETHVHEVSHRLAALGHDVTVLSTDPTGELPPRQDEDGVKHLRVRSWPKNSDYYIAPALYSAIRSGTWDIIHCQGYNTAVPPLAMIAAQRAGVPYVLTFHSGGHSSGLRNAIRPLQHMLLRPLLARAARLICVSNFEKDLFSHRLRLPKSRFDVIPNGTSMTVTELDGEIPTPEPAAEAGPLILSVGRLERYKGHHRILEAMPLIRNAVPAARLRIVGAGPEEALLRAHVGQLGLTGAVQIGSIDPRAREGMAQVIRSAALVTLLSDYEAHPVSVVEALALRRPVLATHTSGLAELADRGLIRSIPLASTTADIAAAVLANLADPFIPPPTTLSSWDDCAASLVRTYRESIAERACAS